MADKIKHIRHRGHIVQKDGQNKCFAIRYNDFGEYQDTRHVMGGFPFYKKSCKYAKYFADNMDFNLKEDMLPGPVQPDWENGFKTIYQIGECSNHPRETLLKRRIGGQRYTTKQPVNATDEWHLEPFNGNDQEWCGTQTIVSRPGTTPKDPDPGIETNKLNATDPAILYGLGALGALIAIIYFLLKK